MEISKVGVIGCGLMGHGIAQVAAQSGFQVVVRETGADRLAKGIGLIDRHLARGVTKGRLSPEEADAVKGRIMGTLDFEDLADCDLVVEAVVENLAAKLDVWRAVDAVVREDALLATNTSSVPVVSQAVAVRRPDRVVGIHFFNPAQVMKLVEVVRAITTSEETFRAAVDWARSLGKNVVETRDRGGFVVNRLLVPYIVDGIRAYEEGVGTVAEIDQAMRDGAGHPMGPLTLCDFIGLDTLAAICDALYAEFLDPRFAQPPLLRRLVAAGWYGVKTGKGLYDYSGETPVPNPGI